MSVQSTSHSTSYDDVSESSIWALMFEVESVYTFRKPHCLAVRGWPIVYVAVCPKAKIHS